MDCSWPLLPKVYLVNITLKNLFLAVMKLEQYRHDNFGQFAHQCALRGKIIVFDQLLGDGTAPGNHMPRTKITECSSRYTANRKAQMMVKIPIFYCQKSVSQRFGHIAQARQHPVFPVRGIDAANLQRIKPHQVDV